jgi:hypothetical protein
MTPHQLPQGRRALVRRRSREIAGAVAIAITAMCEIQRGQAPVD